MILKNNITCGNCQNKVDSGFRFCPKCGETIATSILNSQKDIEKVSDLNHSKQSIIRATEITLKVLGTFLLLLDFIILVWFCWSGYVGHFVKFNKPVPKEVVNIDGEFFNTAGPDQLYYVFLIVLIMFALIKIGFWLIKLKVNKLVG